MQSSNASQNSPAAAPPRNRRNSPSEQTNEALGQIEQDEVEVERDIPAGENQSVERIEPRERPEPPAFEE